jgi:uncharacterized membrane protein
MDDLLLARLLHVLAIVVWFGGIAFVTLVVLPQARSLPPDQRLALFEQFERPFGHIARWAVLVAGASGFWMLWRLDLWHRFTMEHLIAYWWMQAMAVLWLLFVIMLFVLEPLWLHHAFRRWAMRDSAAAFSWAFRLHLALLLAGTATIAGAIVGAH